jgi:adenylylsulfate kinase
MEPQPRSLTVTYCGKDCAGTADSRQQTDIRRIAELARLMNDGGLFVIGALISPFSIDRHSAKEAIGGQRFSDMHVATLLEVCERPDSKGLYRKARAGEIASFTGMSSPYEPPPMPTLRPDFGTLGLQQAMAMCMDMRQSRQQACT